jgi:GT2 family glycosyltransferase
LESTAQNGTAGVVAREPRVSIIILNWNSYDVTRDCLLSLRKLEYSNHEVVVVDNGSIDSSGERLAQELPEIRLIRNEQNLGFAGGNNVGIRNALDRGTDYLLLLNNDTVVTPNFLSDLVRISESDPRIGMANPKIYFSEPPDRIWYAGGSYQPWRTFPQHFGLRRRDQGQYDAAGEVSFITGCAALVKVQVVEKIGLLDEIFFLSFEDVDWCQRARKAGFKTVYVPASVAWHLDSYDTKKNMGLARRDFYNMRGTVLCARRYLPPHQVLLFILSLGKYLAISTLRALLRVDFRRVAALYRGIWSGCATALPPQPGAEVASLPSV